ncbi:CD209 antigen-like protein C isoform X3 [Ruditapes philippinarum]|uniref:CD209 antigen-like protein C isoform X3 n=1 Tax=Ruditapes philippinarum TaxID=129788 RepID=UPI00295C0F52|nr:CD209 antigen-like protein C isoform X3 [Ruditapes philippinarum]
MTPLIRVTIRNAKMWWNICALHLLLTTILVASACPNGWITFNGNCYSFVTTKQTWFHAAKACHDLDAKLVDVKSKDEEEFLKRTIKHQHLHDDPQTIGYWTSGNDLAVEGTWVWGYPEGIPMTTTDWFPGEPNNSWYNGREEDCVALWGHDSHDYQWNDQPCDNQDFYICKAADDVDVVG